MQRKVKCNNDCFNCPFPDCINEEGRLTYDELKDYIVEEKQNKLANELLDENTSAKRKWQINNREKIADKRHEYYMKNKKKIKRKNDLYREEHREEILEQQKRRYHTDELFRMKELAYSREYRKKRRETDPAYRERVRQYQRDRRLRKRIKMQKCFDCPFRNTLRGNGDNEIQFCEKEMRIINKGCKTSPNWCFLREENYFKETEENDD